MKININRKKGLYICHEKEKILMNYDVIIIGARFREGFLRRMKLMKKKPECKIVRV